MLGKAGRDENDLLYVHIKVYKQKKVYSEVVVTFGTVRIRCRECRRWYTVNILQDRVDFRREDLPSAVKLD